MTKEDLRKFLEWLSREPDHNIDDIQEIVDDYLDYLSDSFRIDGGNLTSKERSEVSDFILNKKVSRTAKQVKCDELLSFHIKLLSYLRNESEHRSVGGFLEEYFHSGSSESAEQHHDHLEYKGYSGTIKFSAADGIFYGKVEGFDDLVSFEGSTIDEFKKAFEEAIDDYLKMKSNQEKFKRHHPGFKGYK